jgi:hypothetical protein
MASFVFLNVMQLKDEANRVAIIGVVLGILFSITGLIMKRQVDAKYPTAGKRT